MADWSAGSVSPGPDGRLRCHWASENAGDAQLLRYHDEEWGTPTRDDAPVFEALSLGVFQAGLNWLTILHKRDAFRRAFHGFEPSRIAAMSEAEVDALFEDAAIIRNRAKILATVRNARTMLATADGLAASAHAFAPKERIRPRRGSDVAASTPESTALSARLKADGYAFVGPTSTYTFMQSIGVVNDHIAGCYRGDEIDGTSTG
ncbi:DNA-3-methyladenine glycosylase I [Leifsonia sp. fls2-241-R2A-40a]|uniref:DNA-3-methyladenine glycosylase I n=1 Tax=Leifsonia sp. fls2-241-R2A-40a TaxID=3040290 RepID=UPI00254AB49E|nr:DNA-3-methyladenine glycosylase I [Leifsonia sp. fls2-241-R2A-40a]